MVKCDTTLLSQDDLYLFNEGSHSQLYRQLGAHPMESGGTSGVYFAVWAPNARRVCVMGDFNNWDKGSHPLCPRASSGIWEGFIPDVAHGVRYKYYIESNFSNYHVDKADPIAFFAETSPQTASVVWDLEFDWKDQGWMEDRARKDALAKPISIYEVHLGSWMHTPGENSRSLNYRELAYKLTEYAHEMGFTHVEFLPVMEHPFYGSWGYQMTGYFAPTSRYGSPQDLMFLIDHLHKNGIGVILDWVPSHFPSDEYGLAYFDGTHLYEHSDPRQGIHPDWNSYIFNYGRNEVRSFLLSSALFWLDVYHADGLRVDAVASMLYLDYSRREGEWIPNAYGGRENLDAINFLRRLNEETYKRFPDAVTIAEESTAWPMVSRPTYVGGLGFGFKWDMGWMHDTLEYMRYDPIFRRYHHDTLTFRAVYGSSENFVLPLSHDEVVHGKGSLLAKMPGDEWQKLANLRLLFSYMFSIPGKKLLFMGSEFGVPHEWNHDISLDWSLLENANHAALRRLVRDLNTLYRGEPALHELDADVRGFQWIDCKNAEQSIISFIRKEASLDEMVLIVCNFTPVPRQSYIVGAPRGGFWKEIFNSDAPLYGGSGWGNLGGVDAAPFSAQGWPFSINITLPPLAAVFFKSVGTQA